MGYSYTKHCLGCLFNVHLHFSTPPLTCGICLCQTDQQQLCIHVLLWALRGEWSLRCSSPRWTSSQRGCLGLGLAPLLASLWQGASAQLLPVVWLSGWTAVGVCWQGLSLCPAEAVVEIKAVWLLFSWDEALQWDRATDGVAHTCVQSQANIQLVVGRVVWDVHASGLNLDPLYSSSHCCHPPL